LIAEAGAKAIVVEGDWPDAYRVNRYIRGQENDLDAEEALRDVAAPVLLIVGGEDHEVLALNRAAQAQLQETSRLAIIPGATHLFEETGSLEQVALLAVQWFNQYLNA